MPGKMELKLNEWNAVVSDETQCMKLTHDEELRFLSSKNANLADYLKLHPEKAHELMVPSGFKQCLVRRYERYLGGRELLSTQNGEAEESHWRHEIFDALLPDVPKVVANPEGKAESSWRQINQILCPLPDQLTTEKLAPHYEDLSTGERIRVLRFGSMEVEITAKQWYIIWEHIACGYAACNTKADVELTALHKAFLEILSIGTPYNYWHFPIGQQIAILLKQLEHRLRAAHKDRPNPCSDCCPYRSGPGETHQRFLTKAEAAHIVCEERLKNKETISAVHYDAAICADLEKRGIPCYEH